MADGKIKKVVPEKVRREIQSHFVEKVQVAEEGWVSGPTSEDALTGDMGGTLRAGWSKQIEADGYLWRWRVRYRKLGAGNQHSSEEKPTGSDGIVQIEVRRFKVSVLPSGERTVSLENVELDYEFFKGMLFQSKRYNSSDNAKLLSELKKIEELTPGEGAYIEYSPRGYFAARASEMIDGDSLKKPNANELHQLGVFFAKLFMECEIGVEGLLLPQEYRWTMTSCRVQALRVGSSFGFVRGGRGSRRECCGLCS